MVSKQLNTIKSYIAKQLRRFADWLNPLSVVYAPKKDILLRAIELYEEAKRNRLQWQDKKWVREQIYIKLRLENPHSSKSSLLAIIEDACE
jgi:hypothetical protein